MDWILETPRLSLREMTAADLPILRKMLRDDEVMAAYNGAFTEEETQGWLERQLARYERYGFGLWAVIWSETGEMIGQCGLTMQPWQDREVLEVGYLFRKDYWHQGFATEAAQGCVQYAFEKLGAKEICAIIRDNNLPSQRVALRCGMVRHDRWIKHYRGVEMPHFRYIRVKSGKSD